MALLLLRGMILLVWKIGRHWTVPYTQAKTINQPGLRYQGLLMHVSSCFANVMYRSILYCCHQADWDYWIEVLRKRNRLQNTEYVVIEIYGYNLGRYEEPYCREMSHRHLYIWYSPKLKLLSHVFTSGKESGFFGIIVYTSNLNIAVWVH